MPAEAVMETVRTVSEIWLGETFHDHAHDKLSRDMTVSAIKTDVADKFKHCFNEAVDVNIVTEYFIHISKETFRSLVSEDNIR
jgi:hypothetical protein